MVRCRIYEPIANESNRWYYEWMGESGVLSLASVNALLDANPEEKDFHFDIHCAGGEVEEGLAIYDKLRTSGKNIYMNIEGGCHSMAVCLLLAAPYENRTANANAVAMIHKVSGWAEGTSADLTAAANTTAMLEKRIVEIYADRTGHSVDEMQALMDKQEEHTASELLSLGFISKINPYNTNFKIMAKDKKSISEFLNSVQKFLAGGAKNYEFVDADGNVLFTTEGEDDTLEVGMTASPDGEFVIADGRTVVVADGVITEINDPASKEGAEGEGAEGAEGEGENNADLEAANARIAELEAENAELRGQIGESVNIIRDLRSQIKSNYEAPKRNGGPATVKGAGVKSDEERRAELREKMNLAKGKKSESK